MTEMNSGLLSGNVVSVEHHDKGNFRFAVVTLTVVPEFDGKRKEQLVPLTAYDNLFASVDALTEGSRALAGYKLGARENKGFVNLTATLTWIVRVARESKPAVRTVVPDPNPAPPVSYNSESDVPF